MNPPSRAFARGSIRQAPREQLIPVPESLAAEISAIRPRLGTVGDGWVFRQATKDAPGPMLSVNTTSGRPKRLPGSRSLDGGLWHAYRRKWATERKELPLKDVAAAVAGRM